ncbi:hypothetical protein N8I77_003122 [Diaporthe amygdali]|uniref:Uncharacterized protein n=1 Tax=Phomopsis amygdali TaxID=1214568 RepID=A0AAD9SJP1_PHOAM|nr:hypothetical protein N8I77_003122 [Diaporthe amygdali]
MRASPLPALLGLLAALSPSTLAAPADSVSPAPSAQLATRESALSMGGIRDLRCYNKMEGCKYKDVHEDKLTENAQQLCESLKKVYAEPGWQGIGAHHTNKYWYAYHVKVVWVPHCTLPEGQEYQSIYKPEIGATCYDTIWYTWKNCKNNHGRGGSIRIGCLEYHLNIINGAEVGMEYCHNLPFDNSTTHPDYLA